MNENLDTEREFLFYPGVSNLFFSKPQEKSSMENLLIRSITNLYFHQRKTCSFRLGRDEKEKLIQEGILAFAHIHARVFDQNSFCSLDTRLNSIPAKVVFYFIKQTLTKAPILKAFTRLTSQLGWAFNILISASAIGRGRGGSEDGKNFAY